ncbi:MAG: hypothetical protein V7696_08160 [Halioglobus sp.]
MTPLLQRRTSQRLGSLIGTLFFLLLLGCSDDDRGEVPIQPPVEPTVEALFDSTANPPVLPFPNAIYAGSDGRLALPLPADSAPGDLSDATVAVNTMDGFSTIAPISIDFAEAIDETSILDGDNVRVFEIRLDADGAPTETLAELSSDSDYRVSVSAVQDSRLLIKPLKPLNGSSHYLVGISDSLLAVSGLHMGPSADYLALRSGDSSSSDVIDTAKLSELVQAQEELLIESGLQQDTIVVSLSFPTHSTSEVLEFINSIADSRPIPLTRPNMVIDGEEQPLTSAPFASAARLFGLTPAGQADIYTGSIELPYYMNVPSSATDDVVLDSFMQDPVGEAILPPGTSLKSVNVTVPVLLTIPNASLDPTLQKPAAGWPIAIYQHGITGARTNVLAIADAMAAQGVATIAIDQPLHGIIPGDTNQFLVIGYRNAGVIFFQPEIERHFNLDLDGNDAIDPGGSHYGSARNLLTFRDNLRQCVSDLIYLSRSIPVIRLPDDEEPLFDPDRIHYFSLSLGSMVGTMLAGVNSDIDAFSLAAPGGGNTKFFEGAPGGGSNFVALLAAAGFEQGTQEYEDELTRQTTIDGPGDPINYATRAGELHPIHINEIVGDGTVDNLPDQTIPNTVVNAGAYEGLVAETAPLSGTEPLIRAMNLQPLLDSTTDPAGLRIAARMVRGAHSSQVNYFSVPAATSEIQRQTATFLASDGKSIEVGDSELLEMNFMPAE